MNIYIQKQKIREYVWKILKDKKVALPPFPIKGRIPNFIGSDKAAELLRKTKIWEKSKIIFCSPDSPQRKVRELALVDNKTLIVASPRLSKGFIILENLKNAKEASTIVGMFKYGKIVENIDLKVDLAVVGSVAVDLKGNRIGKGKGYADLEIKYLKTLNKNLIVATTVHDLQVFEEIPASEKDEKVDIIATPSKIIEINKNVSL